MCVYACALLLLLNVNRCDVHAGAVTGIAHRHLPLGWRDGSDNMYYSNDASGFVGVNESRVGKTNVRASSWFWWWPW